MVDTSLRQTLQDYDTATVIDLATCSMVVVQCWALFCSRCILKCSTSTFSVGWVAAYRGIGADKELAAQGAWLRTGKCRISRVPYESVLEPRQDISMPCAVTGYKNDWRFLQGMRASNDGKDGMPPMCAASDSNDGRIYPSLAQAPVADSYRDQREEKASSGAGRGQL